MSSYNNLGCVWHASSTQVPSSLPFTVQSRINGELKQILTMLQKYWLKAACQISMHISDLARGISLSVDMM